MDLLRIVSRLKTTEGGVSAVCKVMKEYEDKAVVSMLVDLIRDGILSEEEAAQRMKMSESDFHKLAEPLLIQPA